MKCLRKRKCKGHCTTNSKTITIYSSGSVPFNSNHESEKIKQRLYRNIHNIFIPRDDFFHNNYNNLKVQL